MSTIYGLLGIEDRDTTVDEVGQRTIYEATQELLNRHNADADAATAVFVQETTTDYQENYWLPGGGMMQESTRLTRPGAVKPIGSYTVAFDLLDWRDQLAWDDISMAYMTLAKYNMAVQNIAIRHVNTRRYQILRHLLNPTNATFVDEVRGSLTVRRLANTDGTTFAPVIGSDTAADDNHYLESGYAASGISDTNNPFVTIRAELEEHWGQSDIVAFINQAQTAKVEALTDFVPLSDRYIQEGSATPTIRSAGPGSVPGTIIGRVNEVWISEWRWMPANYILAVDLMQPAPLKRRIDAPTNIRGRGRLELVAEQEEFPLQESFWRFREGYGVANRLNGVVMELGTGGTYTVPSTYA
jgi:hypothetical protein